jgi:hypothetical protein
MPVADAGLPEIGAVTVRRGRRHDPAISARLDHRRGPGPIRRMHPALERDFARTRDQDRITVLLGRAAHRVEMASHPRRRGGGKRIDFRFGTFLRAELRSQAKPGLMDRCHRETEQADAVEIVEPALMERVDQPGTIDVVP